jgi:hypothetical protein
LPSGRHRGWGVCYSIMCLRTRETMRRMSEVSFLSSSRHVVLANKPPAFLSWLKLSVYMAIVSVAIVLSFHLKSKPSALGTLPLPVSSHSTSLIHHRKANRTSTRHRFLATFLSMHGVRIVELHKHRSPFQSAAGIGANGVEDADCIHCGIKRHRSHMCAVPLYERGEVGVAHVCRTFSIP